MNDAGQTAVEQARSRFTAEFMRWQRSGYGSPDAAFERLVSAIREADPRREAVETALTEALRRYMNYCEPFGKERLREEFGPPRHEGSSWAAEEWLDRVLREPARAALKAVEQASLSDTEEGGRE